MWIFFFLAKFLLVVNDDRNKAVRQIWWKMAPLSCPVHHVYVCAHDVDWIHKCAFWMFPSSILFCILFFGGFNFVSCFDSEFQQDTNPFGMHKKPLCFILLNFFSLPCLFTYSYPLWIYANCYAIISIFAKMCWYYVLLKAFQKCLSVNKCKFLNTQA